VDRLAHTLPRPRLAAPVRYDRTSTCRFRILRRPTKHLAAKFTKLPTERPAAPSRFQTAFHRDVPTARAAFACHQNPCVTKNVCLVAPFRRPIPRATAGAIMGRFAISESVAMPVFAARSYQ